MSWQTWQRNLFLGSKRIGKANLALICIALFCSIFIFCVDRVVVRIFSEKNALLKNLEREYSVKSKAAQQIPASDLEQHLKAFENVLGEPRYFEQDLKKIIDIANKEGVSLRMGEYKLTEDRSGEFASYHLQFPVKGNYQSVRHFVEKSLLALPNASLDEFGIKRESIAQELLDARVKFSVFYRKKNEIFLKKEFE